MINLKLCNLKKRGIHLVKISAMCDVPLAVCVGLKEIGTHLGVLVSGDCCKRSLWEGEGLKNTPADTEQVVCLDDVEARVVPMHGM